jgi:hypothetical protein
VADYNNSQTGIDVDPPELYNLGVTSDTIGKSIIDRVTKIGQIWKELNLGWAGETASEAADFAERWKRTAEAFFSDSTDSAGGTLAEIIPGVLPKVVSAIQMAADNYDKSEAAVVKMFTELADSLRGGGSAGDTNRDEDAPPITENTG